MEVEKTVTVLILEDIPGKSSDLASLVSGKNGIRLGGVVDINNYTEVNSGKPGADVWIVNLSSPRPNARKIINLLPFNEVKMVISATSELAYDAYNAGVLDFIVTPFTPERFFQGLDRAVAFSLSPYRPVDKYTILEKNNMFYNLLQNDYRISDPCCEICKFVIMGKNRTEISKLLNISENTLKVYLREIYSRTIEKECDSPTHTRSKFHLLYMFLDKIYKSL